MAKIAIVGSRDYKDIEKVKETIKTLNKTDIIISGGAKGVDASAVLFAKALEMNYKEYLPDWDAHGKSAGPIRNKQIVDDSDYVIAFWNGFSKGTAHTIGYAASVGKKIIIFGDKNV